MTAIPESCGNCRYCVGIAGNLECRHSPPKIGEDGTGKWPVIDANCWCGEWKSLAQSAAPRGHYAGMSG